MYHLRRPPTAALASLVGQQSAEPLSYPVVGISLGASSPPGYHRLRAVRAVGSGEATFAAARKGIDGWCGHSHAGATLQPPRPPLEADRSLALALRVGPLWVTAACRIVAVIDEEHRYGFAYGTLPHHPAQGEESFLAVRDPGTGRVQLEITASSRPQAVLARLGGPIGRWFQRSMAERYLDGFVADIHRSTR